MKQFRRLVYPYVIWISIFILIPTLLIAVYAFTKQGNSVATLQFTFENFLRFFQPDDQTGAYVFFDILIRSLKIALITTVICIVLGYPVAYIISKMKEKSETFLILLITLPMWINMLVRTYAWIGILSDGGLLSNILGFFGVEVSLMYTDFAVVLGMVYNFIPFMILQIHTSLSKMDESLIDASSDLGASKTETFRRVTLPLSLPGVLSGITLVFLPAVSTFAISNLLGGGSYMLIGNLIEDQFINAGEWNFGSAISLIMTIIILISMYFTNKLDKNASAQAAEGGKLK